MHIVLLGAVTPGTSVGHIWGQAISFPQAFFDTQCFPCQPGPGHICFGAEFPLCGRDKQSVPCMSVRPFVAVTPVCLPCPSLQDFVSGLSVILRGTIDDRLNWAFNLYDLNKDGCITKEVGWGVQAGPWGQRKSVPGRDEGRT